MPVPSVNGSVFIGPAPGYGEFRGWRPSDIPRDPDVVFISAGVDVAHGTVPDPFDGLAYIRDVAAGRK